MKKVVLLLGWLGLLGLILWTRPGPIRSATAGLGSGLPRASSTGNMLAREKAGLFIRHDPQETEKPQNPRLPSDQYFHTGQACMAAGDFQRAKDNFSKHVQLNQVRIDSDLDLANLISLGLACEALGNHEFAVGYFQLATFVCLQQWGMLPSSQVCNFFRGKAAGVRRLEPFEGLVRLSFAHQDFSGAFDWAETIHTLMMWDQVSCPDQRGPKDLPKTKDVRIKDRLVHIYQKMKTALDHNDRELFLRLTSEGDRLQKDWRRATVQLRRKNPHYFSQFYGKPTKAQDIALHANEALIEYQVTESKTFAWLLQKHRIVKTMVVPISRKDLERKIRHYLEALAKVDRSAPCLGAELHRLLIEGLLPASGKVHKLIIIPDGILFDLPFDILLCQPQQDGDQVKAGKAPRTGNITRIEYYRSANELQFWR
jgi:tetratricopeptide (TPR) repeat protein